MDTQPDHSADSDLGSSTKIYYTSDPQTSWRLVLWETTPGALTSTTEINEDNIRSMIHWLRSDSLDTAGYEHEPQRKQEVEDFEEN